MPFAQHTPARRQASALRWLAFGLAGLLLTASLRAQSATFWRSVAIPLDRGTLLPVQTYSGGAPPTYLTTVNGYYLLDPTTGAFGNLITWNTLVRAITGSKVSLIPDGTSSSRLIVTAQQNRLSNYNLQSNTLILPQFLLPPDPIRALFNSSTQTFLIQSDKLYTLDPATGATTQVVDNLPTVFRGAVGANETIWLLAIDNGNTVVKSLSGDGSYTPGASFVVNPGAFSMAVSQWGTIYVSSETNGVASVTAYNASGQVLQTFANMSGPTVAAGASYLNVNSRGVIDLVGAASNLYQQWFDPAAFGATLAIPGGTYSANIGGSESIAAFTYDTATLTGTNTYSGNTTLVNGKLVFGTESSLSASTSLTFAGGTLQISPDFVPATGTLRTTTDAGQDIRVDTNGQSTALTVNATGSSTLTKSGAGTLTIPTDATYTGVTTISAGTLRIGDGGTSGSLASPGIVNNATLVFDRSDASTYAGVISGTGTLTKAGGGALTLSGSNTYTGGTTIHAGTLIASHSQATGTGAVTVEGGVFLVETGVTLANDVILSGGSYLRSLEAGANLAGAIDATSSFAGGRPDTTAKILQGTLSTQGTLESSFQDHSAALNDAIRLSDVYSLHGTSDDLFVLELSLTGLTASSYLGWLDTDTGSATYNHWINAVDGNSGGIPVFFARGYNAATDFYLGYYGVDVAAGSVWAVLDHNSDFAVIPEPATWALIVIGLGGMMLFRRVHGRRNPSKG